MYKQDLVINSLQRLISHKTQPINQPLERYEPAYPLVNELQSSITIQK